MENGFVRTATCERCLAGIDSKIGNLEKGQEAILDRISEREKATSRRVMVWIAAVGVFVGLLSNLDKISAIFHIASK